MPNLLLLEDDLSLIEGLTYSLNQNGFTVDAARTVAQARERLDGPARYDLLLLDVTLPDGSGFAVCEAVRRRDAGIPILFLTASDEEVSIIRGLDAGGDDYLTKPFRLAELRARVNAHLRRQNRTPSHRIQRGGVTFDLQAGEAFCGEVPLRLTRGEYALCEYLALHAGRTFSKEQLYEAAFGFDVTADTSAVTEHVKNIRAKLRACGLQPIETVWGIGYRWKSE